MLLTHFNFFNKTQVERKKNDERNESRNKNDKLNERRTNDERNESHNRNKIQVVTKNKLNERRTNDERNESRNKTQVITKEKTKYRKYTYLYIGIQIYISEL